MLIEQLESEEEDVEKDLTDQLKREIEQWMSLEH